MCTPTHSTHIKVPKMKMTSLQHFLKASFVMVILATIPATVNPQGITCEAGTFYLGETGQITCHFNKDINDSKLNFNVAQYPSSDFGEPGINVLACNWVDESLACTPGQGYDFDYAVTDNLTLNIPQVSDSMAGAYVCDLVSDKSPKTHCVLTVKEPSSETPTTQSPENSTSPAVVIDVSDKQDLSSQEGGDGNGAVVAFLVIFILISMALVAGCLFLWFRYRLVRRKKNEEESPAELQDDWHDIPCCRGLQWLSDKISSRSSYSMDDIFDELPPSDGSLRNQNRVSDPRNVVTFKSNSSSDADPLLSRNTSTGDRPDSGTPLVNGSPRQGHRDSPGNSAVAHPESEESDSWDDTYAKISKVRSTDSTSDSKPSPGGAGDKGSSRNSLASKHSPSSRNSPPSSRNSPRNSSVPTAEISEHALSNSHEFSDHNCPVCHKPPTNPRTLNNCGHTFCTDCLEGFLKDKAACPVCKKPVSGAPAGSRGGTLTHKVQFGDQPLDGTMSMHFSDKQLSGPAFYIITYQFPAGTQGDAHPHTGRPYEAYLKTAYLPDTFEGRTVLMLLKTAFDRRLVFTIGSVSSDAEGIVFNGIDHKTSMTKRKSGYPDSDYLKLVEKQLAAKLVTEEDLTDEQRDFMNNPRNVIRSPKEDFSSYFDTSHFSV